MKLKLLLAFWALCGAAFAVDESEGKAFAAPPPNRPWFDAASGLRMPSQLGPLPCTGGFQYDDPKLGAMVRYESEELRMRADVFIYPCTRPTGTPEELRAAAEKEMEQVRASTRVTQRMGYYSEMKEEGTSYSEFDLYPQDQGKAGMLTLPMRLAFHENTGVGAEDSKVKSVTIIMVFKGRYLKIRSIQPDVHDPAADQRLRTFVDKVQRCVLDPGMRAEISQHVTLYRTDPFSPEAAAASSAVVAYAQITPLIQFPIPPVLTSLAETVDKPFPDAALMFLRAYVVGVVARSLEPSLPEQVDLPQAGAKEVLALYDLMKAQKPETQSPLLEELRQALAENKGTEWLLAHDPAAKK